MARVNPRVDDPLWKSVIEQTFVHFLTFMFPTAADIFDFARGFEYLDKEFETLFPPAPNNKGVRFVDKLVKVYLHSGHAQFILCHIEIQSSKGKGDLPARMFQYYYRIKDRYQVPVTAIAILADTEIQYQPGSYTQEFMGTGIVYWFNSYKILNQAEAKLRADSNPFAVVVLTALLAIQQGDVSDEQLMATKHDLYYEMMKRNMDKSVRQGIYDFLSRYISFKNKSFFAIFEEEVRDKTGKNSTMGTREYLLDKATKEGIAKGIIKGERNARIKAEAEKIEMAKKMLVNGLDSKMIADITGLPLKEIEKLK